MMRIDFRDRYKKELYHFGVSVKDGSPGRGSGRYPLGSGDKPFQGFKSFFKKDTLYVKVRKQGSSKYTDVDGYYERLGDLKKKRFKRSNYDERSYGNREEVGIRDCLIVNGNGNYSKEGRNNNCVYCTVAIAMRAKGYDVIARSTDYGLSIDEEFINTYFPGATMYTMPSSLESSKENEEQIKNIIESFIEQQENGSYGMVTLLWSDGASGHAMFYKIENGNMILYDGQNASKSDISLYINSKGVDITSFKFIRLDNVEPSEDIVDFVVSRK